MKRLLPLAFLGALPLAHAVDDAAVLRCRALVDAGSRLACYDALPLGAAPTTGSAPVPAAATPSTQAQRDFGLQPSATPGGAVDGVQSSIEGRFEGWSRDQQIALANGQVWRVVDGSRATLDLVNPKVRVERGAFGAFYMIFDGTNHSPRVRRVR